MLSQCFGPPLSFPFTDPSSQNRVWDVYQRLSLRLRLGSSSAEVTMDALDAIGDAHQDYQYNVDSCGISRECPMQRLLESPPNVHSVTYLLEDNEWLVSFPFRWHPFISYSRRRRITTRCDRKYK